MAKKLAVKKITDTEATLNDGTKLTLANRSASLLDLYHKGVYDSLVGNVDKSNPLYALVKKSLDKLMSNGDYTELGTKSLDKIEHLVKDTNEYLANKQSIDDGYVEYKLQKNMFKWQRNVLQHMTKKNTLLCGRRSGKSFLDSALGVLHCTKGFDTINGFNKARRVLIIGLSMSKVKDVFWSNLINYSEMSNMFYKPDNSNLIITFENGATIQCAGNTNKTDRERFRGEEYSLIIIDEAQSQQALGYLMSDILGPIIAGRQSTVILSGTGALTNKGYWKDVSEAADWTHFTANMTDNESIPEGTLEQVLQSEFNGDASDITYRREYLAENVIDLTRIVYPKWTAYETLKTTINRIAIGIDYGWNDYTAFVPLGLASDGKIYELNGTMKFHKADVTEIVNKIKQLWNDLLSTYKVDQRNIIAVADTSDKIISGELFHKGIRITNAYKEDRIQSIFDLGGALKRCDVLVNSSLVKDELEAYVWKYDDEAKSVIYDTDDDYFHPDALDALRYSWRYLNSLR